MTYLQDLASNNFQANLVKLSKEKMIQTEAKNKNFKPLPESQFSRIKARENKLNFRTKNKI